MSQTQINGEEGEEPPMYLQRPSSAGSQDISHVLSRTFRQLFTRDTVPPDTIKYLNTSKGGNDVYHEAYVDSLHKIHEERDHRMKEAAMLERHIMQAQARAMSADERALNKSAATLNGFPDLGLPPARSHFRSCIDCDLLNEHHLITPDDFSTEEQPPVPPPSAPPIPAYARDTQSSNIRVRASAGDLLNMQSPLPPISPEMDTFSDDYEMDIDQTRFITPRNKKQVWKDTINAETRETNRRDLENLQARVDYLKNPRHLPPKDRSLIKQKKKKPKETGIKPKPDTPNSVKRRAKSASTTQSLATGTASSRGSRIKSAGTVSSNSTWPISIPVTPDYMKPSPPKGSKNKTFLEMRNLTPMLRALPRTPFDRV